MSENAKRIKKIIKLVNQFSKFTNKLEKAVEKLEWPIEIFFISLTNEIIIELEKINIDNQTPKTHKRISSNISNNGIYIEKTGKIYLYQMISIFDEIKIYKNKITLEYIEYIITPENIQKILHILMATNKITSTNTNVIKERNEFNNYIMNLLINIINLNNKILIDVLSSESQYNVFYQLFILFSKNEENRHLLYDLEQNIFIYYPDNTKLKEIINYTIDCIDEEMNKNNCKKIINEIKKILFLYKHEIKIISKLMTKLIIKIFALLEEEVDKHHFINDFLKFCFNEICFDGNNKFYSRYIFKPTKKAKTLNIRNSNLPFENANNDNRITEQFVQNNKDSVNSNSNNNNLFRGNTVAFNNIKDIEKEINSNTKIDNSKSKNNINNVIDEKNEEVKNDINNSEKKIINVEKTKTNEYNPEFMNFLFDIYNELIKLKMKNGYNIFFIELFLSINNSNEGKNEYSFMINKTNYIKIVLPSILKLKDESLIAVYFSKIIFLSIPSDKSEKGRNDCYIPIVDLNFIFNNLYIIFDQEEKDNVFIIITSQIINLIKMNDNTIDLILNKCNIFESFLSIINNEKYNNEIKKRIISLLEEILKINNNKYKYTLNIPIITYNISDNNLIKKIYSLSLIYENKVNEFHNKIILIIDYMSSLFIQKKIQELIIFLDILLDGIYKNILKISNYKIIEDETINKLNNILYDIATLTNNEEIINFENYREIIFILLNFEYNYNKKYIIYYLNKKPMDCKNKLIIEENIIYKIINNYFINEKDMIQKIKLINDLYIYCLDTNEEEDNLYNNTTESGEREDNNYLLKSPNTINMILSILYNNKDYKCLEFIFDKLMELIKNCVLNIKILLNNNSFIHIIIRLLIDLSVNKGEEKLYIKLNMILNDISKYLSESLLIQYISEIYLIYYKSIDTSQNLDENNNKDIILELFNILKYGIISSKKSNNDYLSLSNIGFLNPYTYNLFFFKNLYFDESLHIYICLNINIRITSYINIDNFILAEFTDKCNGILLSFYITNDKKLKISESSIKTKNKTDIFGINNINEMLNDDENFHKISIIINTKMKKIYFEIDQRKINLDDNNSSKYNTFEFCDFDLLIGYKSDDVKSKLNQSKSLSNSPLIDISNILITRFNSLEEYNSVIKTKNDIEVFDDLLENINMNKKYFEKSNNKAIENNIIVDVNFKNKNINITKSNKIKNEFKELKELQEFLSNDIFENKYINYFNSFFPANVNIINSYYIKLYLFSYINNLEEYYSLNNPNNIILYNINQKYIQSKIFDNYNTSYSACNYYFVDYLISFLFDIEKRRNRIMNKNKEEESENANELTNTDKDNLETPLSQIDLNDSFLNDTLSIIFEIIYELPKREIIDYILYKNDIISTKLKIFFYRNIYLFNENKEFILKLFQILDIDQKSSLIEEESIYNPEILLVIITEIFFDLLIFQKLNVNTQNIILIKLIQILFRNMNFQMQDKINNILFELLKKIYNIILYYGLSLEPINYSLDEENNNPTQIDIMIKCINSIFNIFINNRSKEYINKIIDLNLNIINFFSNFIEDSQNHNIKKFNEENKSFFEYNFLNDDLIYNQLQKAISLISKFQMKKEEDINENIIDINKIDINNTDNEKNICYFCIYLNNYFKIKFDNIYNNIKYDKIMDNNYINLFLNFETYRQILGNKNYGWFLSRNEGNHKIQNKFFLKKNDIKPKKTLKKRISGETLNYEYLYNKEKYNWSLKSLYELFLYDNIAIDFHLINAINNVSEMCLNNQTVENCLYIKAIHKTLSIIIILKEYILILTNICIDSNNKLHVVKNDIECTIWCSQKEEYENELEDYITKNDQKIIKDIFNNSDVNKNKKEKGFGYNNTFKFSYKKIYYKNISEIHKVSYLTIPNSIEIFMTNGKSYFICLNMTKREKIFNDIISNINELYKNKDKKIEGYSEIFLKKSSKNIVNDYFYLKYCPITYLENYNKEYSSINLFGLKKSGRKRANSIHNLNGSAFSNNPNIIINYGKAMIACSTFLSEVYDLWTKNKVSNFDYIMLLNILSERSLNNLSQYFIFPRLFTDFNHNILNWISTSIYRDLSYPILASEPLIRNDIKSKYDLIETDKYHSGTFYSTYAFVSYFLIRQRPFSEISLEIQGGEFDATDRLFIGAKEICGMKEKYQESIPFLMTLPELYINNNKFNFGKRQKSSIFVSDFELPNWSKDDPRKFSLVIKRIFESKNVNAKLNKWIDLIFGIAQSGSEAIKNLNTYRRACYELSLEDIEELKQRFELLGNLIEKQELGYNAKQIFKKPHKKKEITSEFRENENMFFDTNLKLRKIKFIKINNNEYDKEKEKISFKSINDFLIDIENDYIKNININNNYQGGIASLKSIMTALNENNIQRCYYNPLKIIKIIEKLNKFIILGNGYHFLGKNYDYIISHNSKYLEILNFKLDIYYCYYLNETNNISTLVTNDKGNKIYISFDNGNIIEYKINFEDEELLSENNKNNKKYIFPFIKSNTADKESIRFSNIYMYDLNEYNLDKNAASLKRSLTKKTKKKQKTIKTSPPIIFLQKNVDNNFTYNNPHFPEKIIKMKLNEENKILIAITVSNVIYLISLNNRFKLMHIIKYYKDYKFQHKIKDIIPFSQNGDFLIYSSITVHLFSINGVPLCELNLLDKVYESLSKITCCRAVFLYDVILFTGHEDCSIIIWKVKNKNTMQNFNERVSYVYNNNKSKFFLSEYYYNYDFDTDDKNYNYNIQECELQRKFEIVSQIKMEENINNLSINYMKMSTDMSYMIILDNKKDIYLLSNFDDYKEENSNNSSGTNIAMNTNNNVFGYFKEKKIYCISCCKELEDNYYRASRVQSLANVQSDINDCTNNSFSTEEGLYSTKNEDEINNSGINLNNNDKNENKNNKDIDYICEECKLKLINTESYLYNY